MSAKGWTEAEKLGLLFQIIEKSGKIPWDSITLPDGRTRKACEVMIDKEKQKVRKAREANEEGGEGRTGDGEGTAKAGTKQRKANGNGTPAPKKAKTPRKKKETVKGDSGDDEGAAEGADTLKAKAEDQDEFQ